MKGIESVNKIEGPFTSFSSFSSLSLTHHTILSSFNIIIDKARREKEKLTRSWKEEKESNSFSHSPISLFFLLSYFNWPFSSNLFEIDIWIHTLLKKGCQCLHIAYISSMTESYLIVSVGRPHTHSHQKKGGRFWKVVVVDFLIFFINTCYLWFKKKHAYLLT